MLTCVRSVAYLPVSSDESRAELYGVETRVLKQAVRRNIKRFPDDFMLELSKEEFRDWRSQIVMSNGEKMGLRHSPMAFTEQGGAMLSSVLKSDRAIQVNIQIMRAFIQLRQMLTTHEDLKRKIESMEKKYDRRFKVVFDALRQLMEPKDDSKKNRIGF